jgi:hypothetical protein
VFVALSAREYPFPEIDAMHIGRKAVHAYRARYHLVYPVSLLLADGTHGTLLEYDDYFQARRMAEEAAAYGSLPLLDASVEPPQFVGADKVGKPLRPTVQGVRVKPMVALPPRGSRCRVAWEQETAVVRLPLSGLAYVRDEFVKGVAILALITAGVAGIVWWWTSVLQKATSAALGTTFFFCLPLLSLFLLKWAFFQIRGTLIKVDNNGLHYRTRALLFRSTRSILHVDLKSIRPDGDVIEILTSRERIRFGENLTASERVWLCDALNKLAVGEDDTVTR